MKLSEIDISLKHILIFIAVVLSAAFIYVAADIIIILLISVLISYILNPIIVFFEKIHINRFISVLILALISGAVVILFSAAILPELIEDAVFLLKNLPAYTGRIFSLLEKIKDFFGIEASLDSIKPFIIERIGIIAKYSIRTITTAAASVKGIAMITLNLILIPVLVFFLLKDFSGVREFARKIIERFGLEKAVSHLSEFETIVGRYFRGMFFVGLILSVLYICVLFIAGVKGAILLGLLTGMGGIIPYFGFTIGIILSCIAAAVQFHDFLHPLYVVIGFTIVQILESTIITPKIVGNSLGLSPVLVIVSLLAGGAVLGFIGMIIALPVAAFIKVLINRYIFKKEKEEIEGK